MKTYGRELYVKLPQPIANQMNLAEGYSVYMYLQSRTKRIIIDSAAPADRRPTLKELIGKATVQNP